MSTNAITSEYVLQGVCLGLTYCQNMFLRWTWWCEFCNKAINIKATFLRCMYSTVLSNHPVSKFYVWLHYAIGEYINWACIRGAWHFSHTSFYRHGHKNPYRGKKTTCDQINIRKSTDLLCDMECLVLMFRIHWISD